MSYRTTIIASLGAIALVLAAGESFANPPMAAPAPAAAPSGPGVAPSRPGFPAFGAGHHHHRGFGGGFYPGGGYYFGSAAADEPVAPAPPLKQSDDLRFTCVYDIPWDYVHRCPQYNR
jgi:hypothetical protein